MKKITLNKSFKFAIRVVNLYKFLVEEKKEFILSKQLLRSGTSIGANVREGEYAQSKNDFIGKMSIAHKEANETEYWIELLKETKHLSSKETESILVDCIELKKLLISTVKSSKNL